MNGLIAIIPALEFLRNGFPLILEANAKGALIVAAVGVATLCLQRSSAAARHAVWLGAILGVLLLPLIEAALPGWSVLPSWLDNTQITRAGQDSLNRATPFAATAMPEASYPLSAPGVVPNQAGVNSPATTIPVRADDSSIKSSATGAARNLDFTAWLMIIWFGGALGALFIPALASLSLWRLERRSTRITEPDTVELIHELSTNLGLRRSVILLKSPQRRMPMTWGWLRPKVLLPEESGRWSMKRCRVVLLHELAHVKRWDHLTSILAQLAGALCWFNPLVWLAVRRLTAERERACDDIVLAQGAQPSNYAEEVLSIAAGLPAGGFTGFGALAIARRSSLERRLVAILDEKCNRAASTGATLLAVVILLIGVVVPVAMLRAASSFTSDSSTKFRAVETGPSVKLVVGLGSLAFEGRITTWGDLPKLLEGVPDREHTTLELAVESGTFTSAQIADLQTRVQALSREQGFASSSFAGVNPLGSRNATSGSQMLPFPMINVDFCYGDASPEVGMAAVGQSAGDFWNAYNCHDEQGAARSGGAAKGLKFADGTTTDGTWLEVSNAPGAWANTSRDVMYRGYMNAPAGQNITVTIHNLVSGTYDFYVYAHDCNDQVAVEGVAYPNGEGAQSFDGTPPTAEEQAASIQVLNNRKDSNGLRVYLGGNSGAGEPPDGLVETNLSRRPVRPSGGVHVSWRWVATNSISTPSLDWGNGKEWPVPNPVIWKEGQQYVVIRGVAVVSGQDAVLTAMPGQQGWAILSGMQIVKVR